MSQPVSNPFSSRFTRPGCIESHDAAGSRIDVGLLIDRLECLGGTAAIVGPHGSGKSTLLVHLSEEITRRGGRAPRIRLHSWRDATSVWEAMRGAGSGATVCVDGWECLGPPVRLLLRLVAGIRGCKLLVTSHRGGDLPVLVRSVTSAALLQAIVRTLPESSLWQGKLIAPDDVEDAFLRHGGDVRESLWDLYDRFEARVRRPSAGVNDDDREGGAGRAGVRPEIHESADGFSCPGAPERNLG
jgi:GTPase SAR1 family protein